MTAQGYAAFLSYNSADREIARRLQHALEGYSIPKPLRGKTTAFGTIGERIGKVCRDRTDFKSGESLNAALIEALDRSSALIVLCSPDSARSKWVNAEVEHFQKTGRAARIFPIIARTDESGVIVNSYPPALRRADGDEAIAADLQETGDGWHDGVLKLLASILDVDFDALRQRALVAARRRARVAYGIAGGMAALALLAVAASVVAVRQRNRAIENFEDSIVIAAQAASRINTVANQTEVPRELIYDLLTATEADLESLSAMEALKSHPRAQIVEAEFQLLLSDLFAEVGRSEDQLASASAAQGSLDRLRKNASNGARRFVSSIIFSEPNIEYLVDDLDGEVAASMGKAWRSNGALEKARAAFARCRGRRADLLATWELTEEESAEARNGVLACAADEANVLATLGRPGAAIAGLVEALKSAGDGAAAAPYARLVLAGLDAEVGRLKEGLAILDAEIARGDGEVTGRQQRIELAKLLETRARALALTGRIADAEADLARADALLKTFLASDGADRLILLVRGELLTTRGETLALGGARADAAQSFEAASGILDGLIAFDGARRDWRLARARTLIARADNALRLYERDRADREALRLAADAAQGAIADISAAATINGDEIAARLAVIADVARARALRIGGDATKARAFLDQAAARLAGEPADATPMQDLLAAHIADERGDLATAAGDFAAARASYEAAITRQRSYLAKEPAAGLITRDLLWTMLASARSLKSAGDAAGAKARLSEACALKSGAALAEYSLFVRDAEAAAALAKDWGVAC